MRIASRLFGICSRAISKKLDQYSQIQPSSLSFQQYIDFGKTETKESSFLFLKDQLLIRFANIIQEINCLPTKLLSMPSARLINKWYCESFSDLLQFETTTPNNEAFMRFNKQLQVILDRNRNVVNTMSEALVELRESNCSEISSEELQCFLERFYMNRIPIRMLQNQHLLVYGSVLPESPRHVGCIDPECDVVDVIKAAYEIARNLCERYYLSAPEMELECHNTIILDRRITIVTVPSLLFHILFELIKNAMRATVEFCSVDNDPPKLKIVAVLGKEDLSIEISDRGGGVARREMEHLFDYMYSSAPSPNKNLSEPPLAGYGCGLPLSRLYARYFLGDISLVSQEGFGSRATVFLKNSGRHTTVVPNLRVNGLTAQRSQ